MLSSSLPPDLTMQGNCTTWVRLSGLSSLTSLDLGGSHFTHSVWASHMCPLLAGMSRLQKLMLAHCSIPPGKMQQLLPGLSEHLRELNIDRWRGWRCGGGDARTRTAVMVWWGLQCFGLAANPFVVVEGNAIRPACSCACVCVSAFGFFALFLSQCACACACVCPAGVQWWVMSCLAWCTSPA